MRPERKLRSVVFAPPLSSGWLKNVLKTSPSLKPPKLAASQVKIGWLNTLKKSTRISNLSPSHGVHGIPIAFVKLRSSRFQLGARSVLRPTIPVRMLGSTTKRASLSAIGVTKSFEQYPVGETTSQKLLEIATELRGAFGLLTAGRSFVATPSPLISSPFR